MTRAWTFALFFVFATAGCENERGRNERGKIHASDMPDAARIVRQDIDRGRRGVAQAAERLRRGFLVEDAERREREMRQVMMRMRQPPRSINDLMVLPITFIAAVGTDGVVIARDAEEDRMRGFDLAAVVPVVRQALDGQAGYALSEIPSAEEGALPSVTIVFAAPARHEGRVVGAVAAGLPLWRIAQQITAQLQLQHARDVANGELIWVLMLRGEEPHHHAGFPPDLVRMVPSAARRAEGLGASPGGFTGEFQQYGRWYGYGVLPVPSVAPDVSIIFFRSDRV
ncbi:MAG: cache domain-containing protein [Sandaracinaceae bacterium]|nr:cache domain-containing protein [Sandaracinaceae bacterium]